MTDKDSLYFLKSPYPAAHSPPHCPVAMHELPPTSLFCFTRHGAIFFTLNCFEDASTPFYLSLVVDSVGPEVGSMIVGEYGGSLLATVPPMSPDRVIGSPSMVILLLLMCLMFSGSAVRGSSDLVIHRLGSVPRSSSGVRNRL